MCGNTKFLTYSLYEEHKMNEDKHMLILPALMLHLRSYHTEFYKTWYWGYTKSCSINFILICIGIIKPLFYMKKKTSSTDFLEDRLYKILIHDKKCRDSSIRTTAVINKALILRIYNALKNTPSHFLTPVVSCLYANAHCQFKTVLNFCSLSSSLMPSDGLCSSMLTPYL
jgi:hypothetical protein